MGDYSYTYDLTGDPYDLVKEIEGDVVIVYEGSGTTTTTSYVTSTNSQNISKITQTATSKFQEINTHVDWPKSITSLILCLIGIVGCVAALYSLVRRKRRVTTTTHWYLFHVFLSNGIFILTLPFFLIEEIYNVNVELLESLSLTRDTILFLNVFSLTFFLTYICFDRFASIYMYPSKIAQRFGNPKLTYVLTAFTWFISMVLCLPVVLNRISRAWQTIFLSYFAGIFIISVAVMLVLYGIVLHFMLSYKTKPIRTNKLPSVSSNIDIVPRKKSAKLERVQWRVTVIGGILVTCFFVCWVPFLCIHIKKAIENNTDNIVRSTSFSFGFLIMVYINAAISPSFYVFAITTLRGLPRNKPQQRNPSSVNSCSIEFSPK